MPAALSKDLRKRIIEARKKGKGTMEVSRVYEVSRRSVARVWKRYEESAKYEAYRIGGHKKSRLAGHEEQLKKWIEEKNDKTLKEIQSDCKQKLGIKIGINALWHRLNKIGMRYKKNDARLRTRTA